MEELPFGSKKNVPSAVSCYAPFKPPFKYDKMGGYIFDNDNNMIFDMRGWGYLTGTGGLGLSPEEGIEIQDRIGERVAMMMSNDTGA